MTNIGERGHRPVGRGGRVLLRRAATCPTARMMPLKVRSMVGLIPLFAVETLEPRAARAGCRDFTRAAGLVPRTTGPTWPSWCRAGTSRARGERRLLSLLRGHRMKRLLRRMLDETEFLSDYGVRALSQGTTSASPTSSTCDGTRAQRRLPAGRVRLAACSAATRTGAGRSGSRSTTCSSSRCRSSTTTTATTSRSSARPAPAGCITLERGRRRARAAGSTRIFLRGRATAGGRCFGEHREAADRPALPRPPAVPRVLPRRHRPRRRRLAPDRLDRPGREAAAAAADRECAVSTIEARGRLSMPMSTHGSAARRDARVPGPQDCWRGQKALVTGASSGIGRAIAHRAGRGRRRRRRQLRRRPDAGRGGRAPTIAGRGRRAIAGPGRRLARRRRSRRMFAARCSTSSARSTSWSTTPACSRTRRSRR